MLIYSVTSIRSKKILYPKILERKETKSAFQIL